MVSCTTLAIVKLMTLWNYMCAVYNNTMNTCKSIYNYLNDYFYGRHDTWVFIPGHTFPMALSNLENIVRVNWVYDNYINTLALSIDKTDELSSSKISWLSAKIKITNTHSPEETHTYEIDDFIDKFTVRTKPDIPPSLYMVFLCWCAYTKHWFSHNSIVEFHIIDDMGDERVITFKEHSNFFSIKRNSLYIANPKDETNEVIDEVVNEETPLKKEEEKKNE